MAINKAIIFGYVGNVPTITTTQKGKKVATFSMATTEKGYTSQNGQAIPDKTEWHNIVVWGNYATVIERYVKKGSSLIIEGKLRTREYEDKQGIKRKITEIVAESVNLTEKISYQTKEDSSTQVQTNNVYEEPKSYVNPTDDDLPF